jgi:ribosomal protein S27E
LKHGTLLQTIRSQALYIECRNCMHGKSTPVEELLTVMPSDATVRDVIARVRCSKCRAKEVGEVRIVSGAARTPGVEPAKQG